MSFSWEQEGKGTEGVDVPSDATDQPKITRKQLRGQRDRAAKKSRIKDEPSNENDSEARKPSTLPLAPRSFSSSEAKVEEESEEEANTWDAFYVPEEETSDPVEDFSEKDTVLTDQEESEISDAEESPASVPVPVAITKPMPAIKTNPDPDLVPEPVSTPKATPESEPVVSEPSPPVISSPVQSRISAEDFWGDALDEDEVSKDQSFSTLIGSSKNKEDQYAEEEVSNEETAAPLPPPSRRSMPKKEKRKKKPKKSKGEKGKVSRERFSKLDQATTGLIAGAIALGTIFVVSDFSRPSTVYSETENVVEETSGEIITMDIDESLCPSGLYTVPVTQEERNRASNWGETSDDGRGLVCLDSSYFLTIDDDGEEVMIPVEEKVFQSYEEGDTYEFDKDLHEERGLSVRTSLPDEQKNVLKYGTLSLAILLGLSAIGVNFPDRVNTRLDEVSEEEEIEE